MEAAPSEIEEAFEHSQRAMEEYNSKSPADISKFLRAIALEISNAGKEIVKRAMIETAYSEQRLNGELQRTINQIHMFANLVSEGSYVEASLFKGQNDLRRMLVPIGPVVVFGASNFPLAFSVAGGDTISALAAKCPVIVKAPPSHPGTCELVAEAICRAHASTLRGTPGVFSMLHGGIRVGEQLVKHPAAAAIGFTGSFKAGKSIFDLAMKRKVPIPVFAEMGSVNPVFILREALNARMKQIAEGLSQSVTQSVGQFCTNPGLVVVVGDVERKFIAELAKLMSKVPPDYILNEGIRSNFKNSIEKVRSTLGVAVEAEVKSESGPAGAVLFTSSYNGFISNPILQEEVFGPSTLVVECADADQAVEVAKALEGQLTGTIHATDKDAEAVKELAPVLTSKVGRLIFNGFPTGVEVCSAMHHGGPFPATTDSRFTSVGTEATKRWMRPVCFQDTPQGLLPDELKDGNPRNIWRLVNDQFTKD